MRRWRLLMLIPALPLVAVALVYFRFLELPRSWMTALVTRLPGPLPDRKVLFSARSRDGLDWVVDSRILASGASSPHLFRLGQTLTVFYVRDGTDLFAVGLEGGEPRPITIEGEARGMKVDPHIVALPDGRLRLFYVFQSCWCDPGAGVRNEIHSAISRDGTLWTREEGVRLEGPYVDPDVVALPTGGWRMYFTVNTSEIHSAFSSDGLTFTVEPGGRIFGGCVSSTLFTGGQWWTYVHQARVAPARIWVFSSQDGLEFSQGTPLTLQRAGGMRLEAESPTVLREGADWHMVYAAFQP